MKWFGTLKPEPTPPDDIELIRELLDQLGESRLNVHAPRLKVLLTLVARGGEPYLYRYGTDSKPAIAEVVTFKAHLEAALRIITQYVDIQNNPDNYEDYRAQLKTGYEAIEGFALPVLERDTPGGVKALTGFRVDTSILSAQRFR